MRYILQKEIKKQGATMNYDKDGQSRNPPWQLNHLLLLPIPDSRFPLTQIYCTSRLMRIAILIRTTESTIACCLFSF